ncbi:MAG: hypothetical protein WD059_12105 [Balneolaceae bacterium]
MTITLAVLFGVNACTPIENSIDENPQVRYGSVNDLDQVNTQQDTIDKKDDKDNRITLSYTNQSSGIEIKLDPESDQFFLDLTGMKPAEKDTVIIADSTLMEEKLKDIQRVLAKFRQAQDLFYLDEYSEALRLLNETLEIAETADAYALKGTIHFMMGNRNATHENWNRAVRLNPDLPIPGIPELEDLIEEIIEEEQVQDTVTEQDDVPEQDGELEQAEEQE